MRIRSHLQNISAKGERKVNIAYVRLDDDLNTEVESLATELGLDRSKVLRELAKCSIALYRDGSVESSGVNPLTPEAMEAFDRFIAQYKVDVTKLLVFRTRRGDQPSSQLDAKKGKLG